MRGMGGDEVAEAVADAVRVLERAPAGVRTAPGTLRAARALAGELFALAGRLAEPGAEPARQSAAPEAGPAELIATAGALLAAAVRATPAGARFPLPGGHYQDTSGIAAQGVAAVLVTAHGIARDSGAAFEPSAGLAEQVLTRLHPRAAPGHPGWPTLLWARGLGALPGRGPSQDTRVHHPLRVAGERVVLHEATVAAADDLRLGGDGGFDWIEGGPYGGTRQAAGAMLAAYEAGFLLPGWGLYAVVRAADGRALGGIGFHAPPDGDGAAEIGYDLAEAARGRGYATEAVRTLSRWALAQDGVRTLLATVERDNLPSHAVLGRAGFHSRGGTGPAGAGMTLYELSR